MATRTLSNQKIQVLLSGTVVNTLTDGSVTSIAHPSLNYSKTLTSGVNANEADRGWQSKTRTLANGQAEVIDLYDFAGIDIGAGAGNDGLGQALTVEKIVAIAVVNDNAVTSNALLHIEPDPTSGGCTLLGSHTAANGGALSGQGILLKAAPHVLGLNITDSTNHRLRFTATNGPVTYSIYLLARSDDEESSSSSSSTSSQSSISTSSSSQSMSESSISTSSNSSSSSISTSSSSSSSSLSSNSSSSSSP